eukprot:366763_1
MDTLVLFSFLICVTLSSWIDSYNTVWTTPGTSQWGSLPIGNGDLTANVWLDNVNINKSVVDANNYDIWLSFSKSDSYDITGQWLKVIQLKYSLNPPISINNNKFKEILFLSNASILIETNNYKILIWIDINDDILYIETKQLLNNSFSVQTELISWRKQNNFDVSQATGDSFCYNPNFVPILSDNILPNGCNLTNKIMFYHRNEYNNNSKWQSQFTYKMEEQFLDSYLNEIKDPYYNLTFGAILTLNNAININSNTLIVNNISNVSILNFNFLTKQTHTINEWINDICLQSINNNKIIKLNKLIKKKKNNAKWWNNFWNRSQIEINSINSTEKNT